MEKTIIALATPSGRGAISIIRMSGTAAIKLLETSFTSATPMSHALMRLGTLKTDKIKDHIMACCYLSPNSYTGEDLVEIFCHGSPAIACEIISHFTAIGACLAEAGEFTRRAFLNGKVSLAEAEATNDLISAESTSQINLAYSALKGSVSGRISGMLDSLTTVLSHLEVAIDYPEEDLEVFTASQIAKLLEGVSADMHALLSTYNDGAVIRSGVRVALIGLPNVGKSSLLNALLGYDRAIVNDKAGTTRDTIEESYSYKGVLFNFIDTAGLRMAEDFAEKEGVNRSIKAMKNAHCTIWLGSDSEGWCEMPTTSNVIKALGKCDISRSSDADIYISTITGEGLDALKELVLRKCVNQHLGGEMLSSARHYELVSQAHELIASAIDQINAPPDCLATLIKCASDKLGQVVGASATEDVIDKIFASFCVGK